MKMREVLLGILIGAAGAAALTRRRKLKHRGGGDWYPGKTEPVEGSCVLPFEYMEAFMLAVFEGLGVPAGVEIIASSSTPSTRRLRRTG